MTRRLLICFLYVEAWAHAYVGNTAYTVLFVGGAILTAIMEGRE